MREEKKERKFEEKGKEKRKRKKKEKKKEKKNRKKREKKKIEKKTEKKKTKKKTKKKNTNYEQPTTHSNPLPQATQQQNEGYQNQELPLHISLIDMLFGPLYHIYYVLP